MPLERAGRVSLAAQKHSGSYRLGKGWLRNIPRQDACHVLGQRAMSFRPVPKHDGGARIRVIVGESCRFDWFRNHWTWFRPMAWRFILEPPEKKQASRFNDLAHRCVLQVSTRVNSRVRRGTEPYSTTPSPRRAVVLRGRAALPSISSPPGPAKAGFSFRPKASRGFQWPAPAFPRGSQEARPMESRLVGLAWRSPSSKTLGRARARRRQARGCAARGLTPTDGARVRQACRSKRACIRRCANR